MAIRDDFKDRPASAQSAEPVASITTSDGRTFKDVTALRTIGDKVVLKHSEGTEWVPLASLPDEARKSLGLPTIAEQSAFEAAQAKKGLVKYGNDWVTPEEKQRRDLAAYVQRLDALIPDRQKILADPRYAEWYYAPGTDRQMRMQALVGQSDADGVKKLVDEFRAVIEKQRKEASTRFYADLDKLCPTWRAVNADRAFRIWLTKDRDPATGQPYQKTLRRAEQAGDLTYTAYVFDAWAEYQRWQAERAATILAYSEKLAQDGAREAAADRAQMATDKAQRDIDQIAQDQRIAADQARAQKAAQDEYLK